LPLFSCFQPVDICLGQTNHWTHFPTSILLIDVEVLHSTIMLHPPLPRTPLAFYVHACVLWLTWVQIYLQAPTHTPVLDSRRLVMGHRVGGGGSYVFLVGQICVVDCGNIGLYQFRTDLSHSTQRRGLCVL
jgi:hypothetical protein